MNIEGLKKMPVLLINAFEEFKKNDPLRLAAATAFFTTFALPPILIILIQILGVVFYNNNIGDQFFLRLSEVLGTESTNQVKSTFFGFKSLAKNWFVAIGGFIFLMFVATTLFKVVKDTINQLWKIRVDSKKAMKTTFQKRLISMVVILLAGFLLMAGTLLEGVQSILGHYLNEAGTTGFVINGILGKLVSALFVITWFTLVFKYLPDAKPTWKVAIYGGIFTGILFSVGKVLIKYMLSAGDIHTVFGASTSIVFLLLFVFYSSFILYYGACFTNEYAKSLNQPIEPSANAFRYELAEIKKGPKETL